MLPYEELCRLKSEHTEPVASVAFSPDGSLLATCGLDGKLCVWNWASNKLLFRFVSKSNTAILCCQWRQERNDQIICGLGDGTIAEHSFRAFQGRAVIDGFYAHHHPVEKLALSPRHLASGAQKELRVWRETRDGWMLQAHLPTPTSEPENMQAVIVTSLGWASKEHSQETLVATYMYHGIVFYSASDWNALRTMKYAAPIGDAAISPNHQHIVLSKIGGSFEVHKLSTNFTHAECELQPDSSGTQHYPLPVCFAHDGCAVLTGGYDNDAALWDTSDPKEHQKLRTAFNARTTCLDAVYHLDDSSSRDKFAVAVGFKSSNGLSGIIVYTIKNPDPVAPKSTLRVGHACITIPVVLGYCAGLAVAIVLVTYSLAPQFLAHKISYYMSA